MPIRTRRGRAAAYRALWEWPLHSPLRLLVVLAVLVAVVVGVAQIGAAVSGPSAPDRAPAPTATPGPSPDSGPAPIPELRPRSLPLRDASPVALAAAESWTRAWATHPPGTAPGQWNAGLAPFTTEEYLATLADVDPANVPGTRVTGPPQAVEVRPEAVRVQVPTDAVRLELLMVQVAPGDWRVSGYDRASGAQP